MTLIAKKRKSLKKSARTRGVLYILNFLFALHIAIVTYYTSSFISARGIPEFYVGMVYAAGSFSGIVSLIISPRLLKRFGNYHFLIILSVISALSFFILGIATNWWILAIPFILSFAVPYMISFSLDIFLERNTTEEENTGGVRAIFITMANLAFVMAPTIGGWLVTGDNYTALFIVSSAVMVPFILLSAYKLPKRKSNNYETFSPNKLLAIFKSNRDIRNIFIINFLLRIFYSVMVVYIPIYLHTHMNLSFMQIGLISSIALTAFILVEIPLGKIGDRKLGEKEMLIAGFLILSISTIAVGFVSSSAVLVWGVLLFITRVGAAMIDIMNESYFFKHVDASDTDDVSSFRIMSPVAYTIGPILSVGILAFAPLKMLFVFTGAVLLSGVLFSYQIRDTK